jgi:threonine dehydrogenase-like Zn-dependent dehydrogenase
MKALFLENGIIKLKEIPRPVPSRDEALIRVHKSGICNTDLELIKGYMNFKGIPGHEFVGSVVESTEKKWMGKRVVGEININCGVCPLCLAGEVRHCPSRDVLGIQGKDGAFAEYMTLPIRNLHPLPECISDIEAVFIEPLAAACRILEQVEIVEGMSVAVLGDGKLGLLVAQVVRLKTSDVFCYGKHEGKLNRLEGMGIPVSTGKLKDLERVYDVVIEATGHPSGLDMAVTLVKPRGRLVIKSTFEGKSPVDVSKIVVDELVVIGSRCGPFAMAIQLLEDKRVRVEALVDKQYSLEQSSEAFALAQASESVKVIFRM